MNTPLRVPTTYIYILVGLVVFWASMSPFLSMNLILAVFPFLIYISFGYYVVHSFKAKKQDYSLYLFFFFIVLGFIINIPIIEQNNPREASASGSDISISLDPS